jgi:hypothetical protein
MIWDTSSQNTDNTQGSPISHGQLGMQMHSHTVIILNAGPHVLVQSVNRKVSPRACLHFWHANTSSQQCALVLSFDNSVSEMSTASQNSRTQAVKNGFASVRIRQH